MRVALVALTGGGLSGGFRKYLRCLLPRLRDEPGIAELRVFVPAGSDAEDGAWGPLERFDAADARRRFRGLRAELASLRPDVLFVPTARALPGIDVPQVVMVRNMEPFEQPLRGLSWRGALTNLGRLLAARRACTRAERVIAVSRHVAETLARRFSLPAGKLAVVHHGVDSEADGPRSRPAALASSDAPFLFTAGSLRPARGLEDLLGALLALGADAPRLLVAGVADPDSRGHARRLAASVERLSLGERVLFLGRLGEAEMRWCFREATAVVITSRAEACPNTALEALAHGCDVVSTDHPPMPEVLADAARYYEARDATALARQIRAVLARTPAEAEDVARRARARAACFTWSATARATAEVLRGASAGETRAPRA